MGFRRPIVLLALAALLPLLILSAALGVSALRQQQDAMEEDAVHRVALITGSIGRDLVAQREALSSLAELPMFDGAVDAASLAILAERLQQRWPLWRSLTVTDPAGNRLITIPDGGPDAPQRVVEMRSHVQAVETMQPVIGAILRGQRGVVAFPIRAPIVRNSEVRAVLTAVIDPAALHTSLRAYPVPDEWLAGVFDGQGNVVARSAGRQDLIGQPASPSARQANMRAQEGVYQGISLEGVPFVTAYRVDAETGWSVHVGIPQAIFRGPLVRSQWLMIGAALLSGLLIGVFSWLMVREARARRRQEVALEGGRRLEALGRMTGGVAHDFNNLLMIMQSGAELLTRRRADPDRVSMIAGEILSASQRGKALMRQLLAFARRSPHEPISFRLQARAPGLTRLIRSSTREDIEANISIAAHIWPIYCDPHALELSLVNLAVNATDAMPNGGRLSIKAENVTLAPDNRDTSVSGDFVRVTVQDSGVGIPEELQTQIFEPFFTTKPAGTGTGLGLSQVYGFATQSGGAVTVASVVGHGATFALYLPRATEPPAPALERADTEDTNDSGRVLLVEDNAAVAKATENILVAAGYDVVRAGDGAAALAVIDGGEPIDAVLSDIVMPGMSGLELGPRLKERRPALPIVLMTGYSEALTQSAHSGFAVLSKPFTQAEAVAALRAARLGVEAAAGPAL